MFFVLLISIVVYLIIVLFMRKHKLINKQLFSPYLIFISYFTILLLAAFVYLFLPTHNDRILSEKEWKEEKEARYLFSKVNLREKEITQLDSRYIKKKFEERFTGDRLYLELETDDFITMPVFVKKNTDEDQTLVAYLYETKTIFRDTDISEQIEPIQFSMSDNVLRIKKPSKTKYEFVQMKNEFFINQFKKDFVYYEKGEFPERIIYLQIPQNVDLIANDTIFNVMEVY